MALTDKQRVIYTSPIKALSNQKYRELQEEFSVIFRLDCVLAQAASACGLH
ncbi:unnamed protein product [Anisakis simplex]|uniref:Uncharacterized protein n=1 Tax=Anisakis simplex TaxID=6269 RepID=A0A3P6U500_ANISI|nr:unnamed protein product [Anisakis simplex]